jgi:serine/threonine protein phosphatase PrpC
MQTINIYGNTNVGQKRTNNEDAFIIQNIWDDKHILAVVIDGVGGYEGGEVAAEIARKTIVNYLTEFPEGEVLSLLKQAVTQANNNIFENKKYKASYADMACVLTACLFELNNNYLNMVHIGDSRLYSYSNRTLEKLSHDHSPVGYQEEIGALSEEAAMNHPDRNLIDRSVGSYFHNVSDYNFLETQTFSLLPNATYLLCSDGLYDMLTSAEMLSILDTDISVEDKVNALINFANKKGGKDNITVVLVQVKGDAEIVRLTEQDCISHPHLVDLKQKTMNWKWLSVAWGCLIIGFAGGWAGRGYFNNQNKNILEKPAVTGDSIIIQPTDTLNIVEQKDSISYEQ